MSDIILVPLAEEHLEQVRIWRNSPEVSQYMYTSPHINPEEQNKWFATVKTDPNQVYYMIQHQENWKGVAYFYQIEPIHATCCWGFYLGDSSERGLGLGSKTEYRMLETAFEKMGMHKLSCEVFASNPKVIQMHERFGFRREAYYRGHIYKEKQHHDVVGLAMLAAEWQQIKSFHYQRIYNR